MRQKRWSILLGMFIILFVITAAAFYYMYHVDASLALWRLGVDAVLALTLIVFVFYLLLIPAAPIRELAESLRALSIGFRDRRLDPNRFSELEDIAAAFNELASVLAEEKLSQSPSLRLRARSFGHASTPVETPAENVNEERTPPSASLIARMDVDTIIAQQAENTVEAQANSMTEQDHLPLSEHQHDAEDESDLAAEWSSGVLSSFDDIYDAFIQARTTIGSVHPIPSRERFHEMLQKEVEQLQDAYDCKAIHFEIRRHAEDVALQPHLIHHDHSQIERQSFEA
jgi:hypothetical protein